MTPDTRAVTPYPRQMKGRIGTDGENGPSSSANNPAGAPPLDWHSDLPDPAGAIRLAGDFYNEHDQSNASAIIERTEDDMTLRYIVGDTRDVTATIPDGSIDLIFTSPPFLALRSYLPADHPDKHREIGSEANPAAFLDVLLELTAEWGRVLAPHGTLAVELGDTYSGSTADGGDLTSPNRSGKGVGVKKMGAPTVGRKKPDGWPLAKSLACIPQLYMIALAYGINPLTGQPSPAGRWRVRNWIAWHRPNPPVGALGDKWRPASSYITVACRGAKRWFDLDAVRTEAQVQMGRNVPGNNVKGGDDASFRFAERVDSNPAGAPPLDWHTDGDLGTGHIILSTQPYPGSHYATFPVDLPRKIIDCMCPRAVCRVCGVARERVTGDAEYVKPDGRAHQFHGDGFETNEGLANRRKVTGADNGNMTRGAPTLGWTDCGCDPADPMVNRSTDGRWALDSERWRSGIVYDPFAGSGTTLEAAQDLGRDGIGADLDERNSWLARERLGMFAEFETLEPEVVDIVSDLL